MIPTAQKLCIEDPLYTSYSPSEQELSDLHDLLKEKQQLDSYCEDCKQDTVLTGGSFPIEWQMMRYNPDADVLILKDYKCSRVAAHRFCFLFRWHDQTLTKIGQFPSKAALDEVKVKEYKSVLDNDHLREFTRAIGLASHGVGIGSFVYLRRIFERLIEEAHVKLSGQSGWDDDLYSKSRMSDKIDLLKDELPSFLVKHRGLYSILSLGIHELTEDDCLSHFDVVKTGIELILDQKAQEDKQRKKMEAASKQIEKTFQKLRGVNSK